MALPKIIYNTGVGDDVTLQCVNGPQGFRPETKAPRHRNVATSGVVETLLERRDIFLVVPMPAVTVAELGGWAAWAKWALGGGTFKFYPDAGQATYYNCTMEDDDFTPARTGHRRYGFTVTLRVVPDGQAPADVAAVMAAFYGA